MVSTCSDKCCLPPESRWQRSMMASGAPLAAIMWSSLTGDFQTLDMDKSFFERGYSLMKVQLLCRCSVKVAVCSPMVLRAFSIGSKGSVWLDKMLYSIRE